MVKPQRMSKSKKQKYLVIGCGSLLGIVLIFLVIWKMGLFDKEEKILESNEKEVMQEETEPIEEVKHLNIVDENSKSRPVAVMINNISVARPYQSGLQDAYIIYELIVEGGITRYLALFKDKNTERIGTIRSSRHYYLDYALENDAVYVHWGWSPQAQNDIKSLGINNVNGLYYSNKYFWKDNSLNVSTEHRAYTSMEKINKAINDLGYRKDTDKPLLFNYSVDEIDLSTISKASIANHVTIKYSNSSVTSYQYDPENKVYYRSVNNKAHIDYVTKNQYYFKNIITYQVSNSTISGDEKGRQDFKNVGTGTGYYISNGYSIPIKWEKKNRSSQTKYYYENGEELKINDGNTFIQIQPSGQSLDIS